MKISAITLFYKILIYFLKINFKIIAGEMLL